MSTGQDVQGECVVVYWAAAAAAAASACAQATSHTCVHMADKPGCETTEANIVADGTDFGKSWHVAWHSSKADQGCKCQQLNPTGTAAAALQQQGQQRALQHANMRACTGQITHADNCMKTVSLLAAVGSRQQSHMMHHILVYAEESRECTKHKKNASSRKPLHQYFKQQVVHSCRQCCRQKNVITSVAPEGP